MPFLFAMDEKRMWLGRGGGDVVSVPAFYSVGLSSNPADAYSLFIIISFKKERKKQKRGRGWPIF